MVSAPPSLPSVYAGTTVDCVFASTSSTRLAPSAALNCTTRPPCDSRVFFKVVVEYTTDPPETSRTAPSPTTTVPSVSMRSVPPGVERSVAVRPSAAAAPVTLAALILPALASRRSKNTSLRYSGPLRCTGASASSMRNKRCAPWLRAPSSATSRKPLTLSTASGAITIRLPSPLAATLVGSVSNTVLLVADRAAISSTVPEGAWIRAPPATAIAAPSTRTSERLNDSASSWVALLLSGCTAVTLPAAISTTPSSAPARALAPTSMVRPRRPAAVEDAPPGRATVDAIACR